MQLEAPTRKETGAIEKTALDWNPQGYGRRGRANKTWRRTTEDGIRNTRRSWKEVKGQLETAMPGSPSWMRYVPHGVKGFDGDDDDKSFFDRFSKNP